MAVGLRKFFISKPEIRFFYLNKQDGIKLVKCYSVSKQATSEDQDTDSTSKVIDGFEVLRLYPRKKEAKRGPKVVVAPDPPRTTRMIPEQDWMNVWPGPRTFHPATVPLPLHQGCNKHGPPPGIFANTELMKIPNFLHLTPPAIEKHCKALKKFCTKWPKELKSKESIRKHFPISIITSDYCHSSPSIREPKARVVSLKVRLGDLDLDKHARDKFIRLVGSRYDPETGYVTITTDSCPIKKQNYEYAHYLLTAVYFESWKSEDWEKEKSDEDMAAYLFSKRQAFKSVKAVFEYNNSELPDTIKLGRSVEKLINKKETLTKVQNYKNSVLELLSLPPLEEIS